MWCLAFLALSGATAIAVPNLVSTASLDGTFVTLTFGNGLDPATATNIANYAIPGATVQGATLFSDGQFTNRTVVLTVSGLGSSAGTAYSITGTAIQDENGNAGNVSGNGTVSGWAWADIGTLGGTGAGSVRIPGVVATTDTNSFNMLVAGYDIWYTADGMGYIYKSIAGDFDVMAKVNWIYHSDGTPDRRGGLMVRESVDPGSKNILAGFKQDGTDDKMASWRNNDGGNISGWLDASRGSGPFLPDCWVRLRRTGQIFTVFHGLNGNSNWTEHVVVDASADPYPDTALIGLAASSNEAEGPGPANFLFSNFSTFARVNAAIGIVTQPSAVVVSQSEEATFSVNAVLTNGQPEDLIYEWKSNGVSVAKGPSSTFTIPSADLSADGSVFSVVISATTGVTPVTSSNATLTVVSGGAPSVVSGAGLPNTSIALRFDKRLDPNSATTVGNYTLNGGATTIDSATLVGESTVVLRTSGLTGSSFVVGITNVQDLVGHGISNSFSGSIISDETVTDIIGTWYFTPPSLVYAVDTNTIGTVVDGGIGWFNGDTVNFVYKTVTGDFDLRTRVTKVTGVDGASNMSLDARDSIDSASRHVGVSLYGVGGPTTWAGFYRLVTAGGSAVNNGTWNPGIPAGYGRTNLWLRLKRVGTNISSYGSVDGQAWVQCGQAVSSDFPSTMVVGLETCTTDVGVPPVNVEYSDFGSTPKAVTPPALNISPVSTGYALTWPTNAPGFSLVRSTNLIDWTLTSTTPAPVGNSETVTRPKTTFPAFYRLSQ
jgi:hypothetical protein